MPVAPVRDDVVDQIGGPAALPAVDDGHTPLMVAEVGGARLIPGMVITALASRRTALIGFGLSLALA